MTIYKSKSQEQINDLLYQLNSAENDSLKEALLSALSETVSEDSEGIIGYIKNAKLDIGQIDEYIADMRKRKEALEYGIEVLSERLRNHMTLVNLRKIEGIEGSASLRKSTIVSVSEAQLESDWFREKVERVPDKIRIKEALLEGSIIAGAQLIERENVVVK